MQDYDLEENLGDVSNSQRQLLDDASPEQKDMEATPDIRQRSSSFTEKIVSSDFVDGSQTAVASQKGDGMREIQIGPTNDVDEDSVDMSAAKVKVDHYHNIDQLQKSSIKATGLPSLTAAPDAPT